QADDERREDRDGERSRPGTRLDAEPTLGARSREARQDDHAQRIRNEDERDVERVGGKEAVRLDTVAKLPRENGARHRGRSTDRGGRDPRENPATNGTPAYLWTTLHRCRATIASSGARASSTRSGATSPTSTRAAPAS